MTIIDQPIRLKLTVAIGDAYLRFCQASPERADDCQVAPPPHMNSLIPEATIPLHVFAENLPGGCPWQQVPWSTGELGGDYLPPVCTRTQQTRPTDCLFGFCVPLHTHSIVWSLLATLSASPSLPPPPSLTHSLTFLLSGKQPSPSRMLNKNLLPMSSPRREAAPPLAQTPSCTTATAWTPLRTIPFQRSRSRGAWQRAPRRARPGRNRRPGRGTRSPPPGLTSRRESSTGRWAPWCRAAWSQSPISASAVNWKSFTRSNGRSGRASLPR